MKTILCVIMTCICQLIVAQNIGIGTTNPTQKLDINGKVKIGNDEVTPAKGTIRWNEITSDFEGFDGTQWLSLTQTNNNNTTSTSWPTGCNSGQGGVGDFDMASSTDGSANDRHGTAVAMYGDYAVVGAEGDNSNTGAAYVYRKEKGKWVEKQKLLPNDQATGKFFGSAVAIFENYIIVGARSDDEAFSNAGAAYVYFRNSDTWSQQAKLLGDNLVSNAFMGTSVDIDGITAVVGATNGTGAVANSGCVYIFTRNGTTWTQQTRIFASVGNGSDSFGESVAVSGDKILCGDVTNTVNTAGAVFYFKNNGGTWSQEQTIIPADGAAGNRFGNAVDLNKNMAIIGARLHHLPFATCGAAYVYNFTGTAFELEQKLSPSDLAANDGFGTDVALSDNYIIVGANFSDPANSCPGNHANQGKVYTYRLFQGGIIEEVGSVYDPYGLLSDEMGTSVSIYNDCFISGAPSADINGKTNKGKVMFGNVD